MHTKQRQAMITRKYRALPVIWPSLQLIHEVITFYEISWLQVCNAQIIPE